MKKCLIVLLLVFLTGCGGPLKLNPPDSLNYSSHNKVSRLTVGIYIPPEMKVKKFDPCEKLIFGSTQCYTGEVGKILEKNAFDAYSKGFANVVILDSTENIRGVDVAVQISYKSYELKTRLEGPVAYRDVILKIEQKILYPKRRMTSKYFSKETKCKAWKCRIGGKDKGMSGGEVVLKQLFLPGFAVSGYGKALANIVNTAFCASLRDALTESVYSLKRAVRRM